MNRINYRKMLKLLVFVGCMLLLFASIGVYGAGVSKPTYKIGDKWDYKITSLGSSADMTMKVIGAETVSVKGKSYNVYVLDMTISGFTNSTGKSYMDRNTNGVVKTFSTASYMGYTSESTTEYDPPSIGIRFPLDVGNKWTIKTNATTITKTSGPYGGTTTTSSELTTNYTCEKTENINTPAGSFKCYKIKSESSGSYSYSWYSSKAGYIVKQEEYDSKGSLSSTIELISYSFSGGAAVGQLQEISIYIWAGIAVAVIAVVCIVSFIYVMQRKKAEFQPQQQPAPPPYPVAPPIETTMVRCGNCNAILTIPKPQGRMETQCPHCGARLMV